MRMVKDKLIRITKDLREDLKVSKLYPRETYTEVIYRMMEAANKYESQNPKKG